jgi:NAD(P)H-dependent FMN reductase
MNEIKSVHVIGLNGSPHRAGNTVTLMGWVLDGCAASGAQIEWLHLVDFDIRYCQGCFTCLRTGVCPIKDDFLTLRASLLAADGIVAGSPVYEGGPSAQFKTFLDRLTLLNLYTNLFERQHSVGVATSGIAPTEGVAKGLSFVLGRPVGIIGAKTSTPAHGYQSLAAAHHPRLPEKAGALGQRLVAAIRQPRRFCFPSREYLIYLLCQHAFLRPMVLNNPDQFAGVLRIWEAQGKIPDHWKKQSPGLLGGVR